MKNLKYILFTFLVCFFALSNALADSTCRYEYDGYYSVICNTSDTYQAVDCEVNILSTSTIKVNTLSNQLKYDDFKSGKNGCADEIKVHASSTNTGSQVYTTLENIVSSSYYGTYCKGGCSALKKVTGAVVTSNDSMFDHTGNTCIYNYIDTTNISAITVTCKTSISNETASCNVESSGNFSSTSPVQFQTNINYSAFTNNGCANSITVSYINNSGKNLINGLTTDSKETSSMCLSSGCVSTVLGSNVPIVKKVSNSSSNGSGNGSSSTTPETPNTSTEELEDYEKDSEYKAAQADAELYCDATNKPESYDSDKCSEAKTKMAERKAAYEADAKVSTSEWTPDSFCRRKEIRGAFRAVGWVIFVIKILVPIILIVFGCIDLGKAVVSSKDDTIKKSTMSLVKRIVAGIIIFFVPTLLDFIIDMVDNGEVQSQFSECTHCMLEPTDDLCGSLIGSD